MVHVVFSKVREGMNIVEVMERFGNGYGQTSKKITIADLFYLKHQPIPSVACESTPHPACSGRPLIICPHCGSLGSGFSWNLQV